MFIAKQIKMANCGRQLRLLYCSIDVCASMTKHYFILLIILPESVIYAMFYYQDQMWV